MLSELIDHVGGQKDVVIGDEVFDRTFVISTAHADVARRFFTPPVRTALLESLAALRALGLGEVVLARNAIHLEGRGHFPVESLDPAIAAMARMARACAGGERAPVERAAVRGLVP